MWQGMRSFGAIVGSIVLAMVLAGGAVAQDIKQMKLTDKQVQGFVDAQKTSPPSPASCRPAATSPIPHCRPNSRRSRKSTGSASFAELDDVAANISIVMAGLDPQTGDYTDPLEALKKELDEVKSDASIPDADKKQLVEELTDAIKTTPPLEHKDNIGIVKKHREEIEKAMQ